MSRKILAIGNALVDIIARISDHDLISLDITPGGMTLVDAQTSAQIYASTKGAREISGGSAANTAAIAASLGARVSYAGKTASDTLGGIFLHDLKSLGITSVVEPAKPDAGLHTGNCLSLITPDAQRTMCTHLGAAQDLCADDVSRFEMLGADMLFLEGYLLDAPDGYAIFHKAVLNRSGLLCLTLSDANCVARHAAFLHEIVGHIDLLFGNETEMMALFPEAQTAEQACQAAARLIPQVVCTDGPNGVYIGEYGRSSHLPAHKAQVVDTTGAGDSLAGTVLWALADDHSLSSAVQMALRIAAEVISEIGARPSRDIRKILEVEGYLAAADAD